MKIKPNEIVFEKTDDPNVVICYKLEVSKLYLNKLKKQHRDLITEVIKYKQTKVISEELGKIMLNMAEKWAHKTIFGHQNIKEDMISESTIYFIKALDMVEINQQDSVFSYFITVIKNSFLRYLQRDYKYEKIKDILYDNQSSLVEYDIVPKALDYTTLRPEYV